MLKESENPPVIWPSGSILSDIKGTWWVAHTRSRNEKALAWQMQRKDIGYFLPMHWKVSQSRGRKTRSLLPLFTGYIFFCGSEEQRIEVLRTNRVANLIEVLDQQRLIADLMPIERALSQGAMIQPHEFLGTGQRCRVIAGPLMGIEGVVVQMAHKTRLVLQVEMLGRATSIEVDTDMIESVDGEN